VLAGVRVLGTPEEIGRAAARHRVQAVLVPAGSLPPLPLRALVTAGRAADVRVQVVPDLDALLAGTATIEPRDVDIHDLLPRDPVVLDGAAVGRFLKGRVVLITGAAGSIGQEICRQVLAYAPRRLILLDHSENGLFHVERELRTIAGGADVVACLASITDSRRIRTLLSDTRPDVVFHAAAHKHVPMLEANPGEGVKNNVFATRTPVDEVVRAGAEAFVMISTDKAVKPSSVMGACKRLAEMYVQALSGRVATRLVTVRFGNVLGSNGSVIPLFQQQIRNGGPVTVTHPEMTRYFMTIPEASQLVLQAGAQGRGGEIFVLDMGAPVKVLDLARDLIRLSGLEDSGEIEIIFTGVRPGEKLSEELYTTDEQPLPTSHPKILRARHRLGSLAQIRQGLADLARAVDSHPEAVIAALMRLIPEFDHDWVTHPPSLQEPAGSSCAEARNGVGLEAVARTA
jgi:FlaA1/EpsC-like NDP-sugar epimerase